MLRIFSLKNLSQFLNFSQKLASLAIVSYRRFLYHIMGVITRWRCVLLTSAVASTITICVPATKLKKISRNLLCQIKIFKDLKMASAFGILCIMILVRLFILIECLVLVLILIYSKKCFVRQFESNN